MNKIDLGQTFEERQVGIRGNIQKIGIPLRDLNKKELEEEIKKFLKRKQCLSLATVSPDGVPRISLLDYQSDGLDIIMASEGGEKFRNLHYSRKVAISIGFSDGTAPSEYGLTVQGEAEIFKAPDPRYLQCMMKMKPFLEEWAKAVTKISIDQAIKRAFTVRAIKVSPLKMTYMNIPDGVPLLSWERD